MDLADAHVAVLEYLRSRKQASDTTLTLNLGTGVGYSVLEMVDAFEQASGRRISYRIAPRRAGDTAKYWADPAVAEMVLGWQAKRGCSKCVLTRGAGKHP